MSQVLTAPDIQRHANGVIRLDDALSEEILTLAGGAAAPCFQCGACTATCPWGLVGGEGLAVRTLMRRAQLGLPAANGALWRCTTCAACEPGCPRGVPIAEVMVGLREVAWRRRQIPAGLNGLMWGLYTDGNPWGRPPSQRAAWMSGLDVPAYAAGTEVLLYVGCTAAYDQRMQRIARAMVGLLRAAGVDFGVLGETEPCCGESAHALGQPYADEIVASNERRFTELGVRTLVALSPHCADMFRAHHFQTESPPPDWRPLHHSEFLAELVVAGRLPFGSTTTTTVTYHDPCYLGRRGGIYDQPRALLSAIPGVDLVEMEEARDEALCCGGGGGRMWQETEAGQRFGDRRIAQARATGATLLATACPHCIACLEDAARLGAGPPLRVRDIAEVAAEALGSASGRARQEATT